MRRRHAAAAAVLVLAAAGPAAAETADDLRGYPLVETVIPDADDAGIQNFGVAADPSGLLYVANLGGLLIHDGAHWRSVAVGGAETAFSVAIGGDGRVAVGGISEIGYLESDPAGVPRYVSLVGLLPAEDRDFGQVLDLVPTERGFLFATTDWIVEWEGGATLRRVAELSGERPFTFLFPVAGEVYGWGPAGLLRYDGRTLVPVAGGEAFRGRRVDAVLPAAGGGLVISVRGEGLFRFRDGAAEPFDPEASRWAAENRVLTARLLPDGRAVLGSILGGILVVATDGAVEAVIDSSAGLPDDLVYDMAVDREGGLWLALNNDLARVAVASPVTLFDQRSGLVGSAYHAARHAGELWVGGAAGLFTTAGGADDAGDGAAPPLHPVEGVPPGAWYLLSRGDHLLVATADGIFRLGDGAPPRKVEGAEQGVVYVLASSPSAPDRVWAGIDDSLVELRRDGGAWRAAGRLELPSPARSIVEIGDTVWCGTELHGAVEVPLPLTAAGRRVGEGKPVILVPVSDGVLAVEDNVLRRFDPATGRMVDDPALAAAKGAGDLVTVAEDAGGNLWLNSEPVAVLLRPRDGAPPRLRVLHEVPARSVESFLTEADGSVWMASEDGVYRHEGDLAAPPPPLPAPLLARVTDGHDQVLLAGAPGRSPPALELEPDSGRLRLTFAPLSHRSGLRYQTRLDPVDDGWSKPVAEPFAELTGLPPGRYTFRVRTLSPGETPAGDGGGATGTSAETVWSFRVRPPWYRSGWAWALWTLLAAAAVSGYGSLRSRTLRRRAEELEARVEEGTRELQRTVDELRRTQGELEAANTRLRELSRQDELTGVANRRRLQEVLDDEWSRARRQERPLAFILLDLDHFKLLNDSRGHREGDRCLQQVARYLEEALPRRGDLLVRYGGEEFAVLLPDTDLESARLVAERLRSGLEELDLPHDAAPLGHVTASLGVAATVPAPGERPGRLIEAADLALYRAKTEGRNRVRVDDGTAGSGAAAELASN